jgi:hypothetical protein
VARREYIGDFVKRKWNEGTASFGKKLWHGTLQFFGSGFGKGVLTVGVAFLGVNAVLGGFNAAMVPIPVLTEMGVMPATIGQGVMMGLQQSMFFLASGAGMAVLAAGGAIGAVLDHFRKPAKISLAEAEQQKAMYDIARQHGMESKSQMPMKNKLHGKLPNRSAAQRT